MTGVAAISHAGAGDIVAFCGARAVDAAQFMADVERVAHFLPERAFLVNLCADRYRFAVGLIAALVRGQKSLLPPDQTPAMLLQLQRDYANLYALGDGAPSSGVLEHFNFPAAGNTSQASSEFAVPLLAEAQIAAIAFTSGSTAAPRPHPKTWGALARGATAQLERLGLNLAPPAALVATVPAQHMFGLESSVLLALRGGLALHSERPFYPADVARALGQIPVDRVLVTTPVHLRALLNSDTRLPPLRQIICATAPLSPQMAAQVEVRYAAPLYEVYGFTEAGMVATRRTVRGPEWQCLNDLLLRGEGNDVRVAGGHVEQEVAFTDLVQPIGNQSFILHGRSADLVNIAGKRTSLGHLNHQLNSIKGVQDGVFFMPDEKVDAVTRLTALVVAPGVQRETLMAALRERIDAVFLPRPLYLVDALPRNATGKLPRDMLLQFARACAEANNAEATWNNSSS